MICRMPALRLILQWYPPFHHPAHLPPFISCCISKLRPDKLAQLLRFMTMLFCAVADCNFIRSVIRLCEQRFHVEVGHHFCPGHAGEPGNELVDSTRLGSC